MENILESYLVGLGFKIDDSSYRKFEDILARADSTVEQHTSGMLKSVLKAQTGILGAFTAMSAAAIGLADKVAMADQGYRLFGLQMLTTTETARKLKLITDGLGASLEQVTWDPELHQRAMVMSEDIDRITKQLGPDFEKNMKGIRDIRFQFTELGLVFKGAEMQFGSRLFESLGLDAQSLHGWIEKLATAAPGLATKLADGVVPVLRETWTMLKEITNVGAGAATIFTNLIGALSGDSAIVGTTFKFENLAKAMEHVLSVAARAFHAIANAEGFVTKTLAGDFKGAFASLSPGGTGVLSGVAAGTAGAVAAPWIGGAVTSALTPFIGPFALPVGIAAAAATPAVTGAIGAAGGYLLHHNWAKADAIDSLTRASPSGGRSTFDAIANAIIRQENIKPGSPYWANNNPGDLVYAGQPGATRGVGGFAHFKDEAEGRAQLIRQLQLDAGRGLTLAQEIEKWAPRNDPRNNTDAYIRNVAAWTGISPSSRLSDIKMEITVYGGDINVQGTNASTQQMRKAAADGATDAAQRLAGSQRQWIQAQLVPAI